MMDMLASQKAHAQIDGNDLVAFAPECRVKAVIGEALIMRFTGRPRGAGTNDRLIRYRQNGDLLKRINVIVSVQSCLQKFLASPFGRRIMHDSGASRRGIAESYPSTVIAREGGRSSIPETLMMELRGCGVLDIPCAGNDDFFGAASSLSKRLAKEFRAFQSISPGQFDRLGDADAHAADDVCFADPRM
jgi:hypothetical protein